MLVEEEESDYSPASTDKIRTDGDSNLALWWGTSDGDSTPALWWGTSDGDSTPAPWWGTSDSGSTSALSCGTQDGDSTPAPCPALNLCFLGLFVQCAHRFVIE